LRPFGTSRCGFVDVLKGRKEIARRIVPGLEADFENAA
jgi:hypothetical protein